MCVALKNGTVEKDYVIRDDYRRQNIGESCSVAGGISEQNIIQVNPVQEDKMIIVNADDRAYLLEKIPTIPLDSGTVRQVSSIVNR